MAIQSIRFPLKDWNADKARYWLKKHGFKAIKKVDQSDGWLKYRIEKPEHYDTFKTLVLKNGIHFILGC